MKRLICLVGLLYVFVAQAQKIDVEFEQLHRDLIARTQPRMDLNDDYCAVIRVSAANVDRFSFEGNVIGNVIYSQGEALVYMTQGSKRLKIKSNDYGTIIYDFPERLQKQSVYRLALSPAEIDLFSSEKLLEAEKIRNRHLKATGLYKIVESGVLPPYTEIKDVVLKNEGKEEIYCETQISLDTLNKKMFYYESGPTNGIAYGRSGKKYWGGHNGRYLFINSPEPINQIYELVKAPFGLNFLYNKDYLYTIGDTAVVQGKECDVVLASNKDNKKPFLSLYFAKDTGLLFFVKDEVTNSTISYDSYKQYGDYYLSSEIKQVTPNKFELSAFVKSYCIGCPIDDSLLNVRKIKNASKKQKKKK